MASETAGRADKLGNRYERNCIIKSMLEVVAEIIKSCMFEGLGDDEKATDILITNFDDTKKYIQCKYRYRSNDNWKFSGLKSYNLLKNWKFHLDKNKNNVVALESPIPFISLSDLISRAKNNNGNVELFYTEQIKKYTSTFNDFKQYCKELELNYDNMQDVQKAMDYLRRTEVINMPEEMIEELLFTKIKILFYGNPQDNYNNFLNWICNKDIMGKNIDKSFLLTFFEQNEMILNDLSNSPKDFNNMKRLNEQFKKSINLINNNFINRQELQNIISNINNEKSIMITGKAGYGKSGVIHELINYLEDNDYQYLAIKLDKYIPENNSLEWSKQLGFTTYLSNVLNKFSTDKKSVLILDQLDALRWNHIHNRISLDICNDIIKEIKNINIDRHNKISVVLACRTFDFENDPSIIEIIKDKDMWTQIKINDLTEDCIYSIVGTKYKTYNAKLKQLLKIPSNLFIFLKLKKENNTIDIHTTRELISTWWEQIIKEGTQNGIQEQEISEVKNKIVSRMNQIGTISLHKNLLNDYTHVVEFLLSKSILIQSDNIISFSHQSLLDYFSVEKMVNEYLEGKSIDFLIGDRNQQLPTKRYQLQMFLEQIYEINDCQFLKCIDSVINSENIRTYMKYVAFEVLGLVTNLSDKVKQYIIENYNKKELFEIFINTVFMNHQEMIDLLISKGVFDEWIQDKVKKKYVIDLLRSVKHEYNDIESNFIKEYIFINYKLDKELYSVFPIDITYDTDILFETRLKIYDKYNDLLVHSYLNLDKLLKCNEYRAIKYIEFLGQHMDLKKRHIKYSGDEFIKYEEKYNVNDNKMIIKTLLPLIPKTRNQNDLYSWDNHHTVEITTQRIIVSLIKKALKNIIENDYNDFWLIFKDHLNKGFYIYNELILYGLLYMPLDAANEVFEYLFNNINDNCFEYTSNEKQSISMLKKIINKFIEKVDTDVLNKMINNVVNYKSKDIIKKCKKCLKLRKENINNAKYMSYWGDFQYEILNLVPNKYLNSKDFQLKQVLNRKFNDIRCSTFDLIHSKFGSVISPIENKQINMKNWLKILTNKKIISNRNSIYDDKNGVFIDSGLHEFQSSLSINILQNPNAFLDLFITNSSVIISEYVYTLYHSLAYSNILSEISCDQLELLFNTFKYEDNYQYAPLICEIIAKKKETNWHDETINMLLHIYNDIKENKIDKNYIIINNKDNRDKAEAFEIKVINSSIYKLASAIGNLLFHNSNYVSKFINIVKDMLSSKDEIVKYSSINILCPLLNYDIKFASKNIIDLYSEDYIYGYHSSRDILNYIYKNCDDYKDIVTKIILHGINIESERIKMIYSYLMVDFYLFYNKFEKNILNKNNDEIIKDSVLDMLLAYLKDNKYKEKIKKIIKTLVTYKDVKINPYRLFDEDRLSLSEDSEYITELFRITDSSELIGPFIHALTQRHSNIIQYSDLLFKIINITIEQYEVNNSSNYYLYDDLNHTVIILFDAAYETGQEDIIIKCLDIWDRMFSKNIGIIRQISKELSEV